MSETRWTEPSHRAGEPLRLAIADRGAPEWYLAAVLRQLAGDAGVALEPKRFDGGEARRVASVHEGMAEVSIALEETVRWAYRAESAYDGWRHTSFRLVAGIEQMQWLGFAAREDARVASFDDLASAGDLRVLTYLPGGESATWSFLVSATLAAHGVDPGRLRLLDVESERSRIRRLDFDLLIAPIGPYRGWRGSIWQEAAALAPLRFLPCDTVAVERLGSSHGLRSGLLPADYLPGVREPVPTLRFDRWLVFASERLEEDTALTLARALDAGRDRLAALHAFHDPRRPLLDVGVPVHRAVRSDRLSRGLEAADTYKETGSSSSSTLPSSVATGKTQ
jgi:TRAP-type uncharacterized transport system substrate-binding protein